MKKKSIISRLGLGRKAGFEHKKRGDQLNIGIVGGGPVGLTTGIMLDQQIYKKVQVTVFDRRWAERSGDIEWSGREDGNFRRGQVVTIQSLRWSNLPLVIQDAIFLQDEEMSEMWPNGPASPINCGRPRNIKIKTLEDRLLKLAKCTGVKLVPRAFDPQSDLEQFDIIAICDGAGSSTRDYFLNNFGTPEASCFSIGGKQLTDHVLAIQGRSNLNSSDIVALTAIQNRFLLNSLNGYGFLNMRLTQDEMKEVMGVDIDRQRIHRCIQSKPCAMLRSQSENGKLEFSCSSHNTLFKPSIDEYSFLWPRMVEGAKLFDMPLDSIEGFTVFKLNLQKRSTFCTQVIGKGLQQKGVWACLLGDSAISLHFWPGRGLNTGLASSVAFVKAISNLSPQRDIRAADFTEFQGTMFQLQHRETSRAWNAMVGLSENKKPIRDLIAEGLSSDADRGSVISTLINRANKLCDRIDDRMTVAVDRNVIRSQLEGLTTKTLNSLCLSGAWETVRSGGEEVHVKLPDIFGENIQRAS